MPNQIINTIGLLLNTAGIVFLFFYGPPQPTFEEGVNLGLENANLLAEGRTVAYHNTNVRKLKIRHEIFSRVALLLIFVGFVLQLWATWLI